MIISVSPDRGGPAGGTAVVIQGSGFTGATFAKFDGVAGTSFSVFDDNFITVTTPAHVVGAVTVEVDGAGTLVGGFTYASEVTDVNPGIGGKDGGVNVVVVGNGFTGATSVTFGGVAATSVVVLDDSTITCDIPAHALGTVDVVVTGVGTFVAGFVYDSQQWAEINTGYGGSDNFRDSFYLAGVGFTFVGDNGLIYQSVTGLTGWTARTSPGAGTQAWKGIAFSPTLGSGSGRYCIVGNSGAVATSDDAGVTWTARTGALATQLTSVSWSPTLTLFVSVSVSGTVQSSPDGITWTTRTASVSRAWQHVSWSADAALFIALASDASATNCIMTSPDGINWTTRTNPAHALLGGGTGRGIVVDTTAGHAAAYFMQDGSNVRWLVHTLDGMTWTKDTLSGVVASGRPNRIVDAPAMGGYLIVGLGFNYHFSDDGVTWVETVIPSPPMNFRGDFCLAWAEDLLTNVSTVNGHPSLMQVGVFSVEPPTLISIDPATGPVAGGTSVTLTGTAFPATANDLAITFDGVQAVNVVRVSDTEITCDTPPHSAGPVDVELSSEAGDSTLTGAFTYVGNFASDSQLLSARRAPAISIAHQLNGGVSSLSFAKDGIVDVGATIYATDPFDARRIFTGPILKSELTFDGDAISSHVSKVSATDKRWFLDKMLPYGKWEAQSVDTVVGELLASFAPDFGYEVEAGLGNITLDLNRTKRLSEVFTDIAGVTGSHYRLDSELNKVIIGPLTGEETPDVIDDNDDQLLLDEPIKKDTDLSQIRTRVYVFGKNATGSDSYQAPVRPSNFTPDVDSSDYDVLPGAGAITIIGGGVFSVFYQLSAVTATGEAFTISGATSRQWLFYWDLPTPSTAFALRFNKVRYHEDVRVTKIRLYRVTQTGNQHDFKKVAEVDNDPVAAILGGPGQYVAITDTVAEASLAAAADAPTVNDTATIVAVREDLAAQATLAALEGGDGVHEFPIFDGSIITLTEAEQRGDAELELFKNPLVTVSYATRDPKSKIGRDVEINLTDPPIVGTFRIQTVNIDQIHDSNDLGARYRVMASSQRFTLADLFHRLVGLTSGGGGSSSVTGGTGASGGSSGWATQADKLTQARNINSTAFDGTASISINAAPDHLGETPSGTVNGVNAVFTTAVTYKTGSLTVYVNGVRQKKTTHWSETTTTTFTMSQAPVTGDLVTVDYESN